MARYAVIRVENAEENGIPCFHGRLFTFNDITTHIDTVVSRFIDDEESGHLRLDVIKLRRGDE